MGFLPKRCVVDLAKDVLVVAGCCGCPSFVLQDAGSNWRDEVELCWVLWSCGRVVEQTPRGGLVKGTGFEAAGACARTQLHQNGLLHGLVG